MSSLNPPGDNILLVPLPLCMYVYCNEGVFIMVIDKVVELYRDVVDLVSWSPSPFAT